MSRREPFSNILVDTLSAGWSAQYDKPVTVYRGRPGQVEWRVQPLLNGIFVPEIELAPRRFLRDSFAFTAVTWRMPAQYLIGRFLSSTVGIKLSSRFAFSVSGHLPDQENILIVPGNRRIRIFNFKDGSCRVVLKKGFDSATMEREIEVRGCSSEGPFPLITAWQKSPWWFEEKILDAYPLPRCPGKLTRQGAIDEALRALDEWSAPTRERESAAALAGRLLLDLSNNLKQVATRFPGQSPTFGNLQRDILLNACSNMSSIETTVGHGDFQPGNIMVGKGSREVSIIDWEHSTRRFALYDRLVLGLGTRLPSGLAARIGDFIEGWTPHPLAGLSTEQAYRTGLAGFLILEDLIFYSNETLGERLYAPTVGFLVYCREVSTILRQMISCQRRL